MLFSVAPKPKLFGIFNKFDGVGPQCSSAHHHFTHAARFSSAYEMLHVELIFGSRKEKRNLNPLRRDCRINVWFSANEMIYFEHFRRVEEVLFVFEFIVATVFNKS